MVVLAGVDGAGGVGAVKGRLDGLDGGAHGAAEGRAGRRGRLGVGSLGVADLAARVAAVAAEGELAAGEVVHAQVEELDGDGATAGDDDVDAEVHVAVGREVVVAHRQAVERREEAGKVTGGRGPHGDFGHGRGATIRREHGRNVEIRRIRKAVVVFVVFLLIVVIVILVNAVGIIVVENIFTLEGLHVGKVGVVGRYRR